MALLTEQDVLNIRFKRPTSVETGYDEDEVDFFLDEVAETIRELTVARDDAENRAKIAEARASQVGEPAQPEVAAPDQAASTASFGNQASAQQAGTSAAAVLQMAQETYEQLVARGQSESDQLVGEAKAKSAKIVSDAEVQSNRTLANLEQERGLVERKISELRDFERDYRTRLKSYLESLLGNVEAGAQEPEQNN